MKLSPSKVSSQNRGGAERPLISIICPAYNEEKALPLFHQALEKTLLSEAGRFRWEVLYVDDGSADGTWQVVQSLRSDVATVVGIQLAENRGQQNAMTAGLDTASGEAMVTLDTDLQHPPGLIPELLAQWLEGTPVIQTIRLEDPSLGWFKRITSRWVARFLALLTGLDVRPGAADFRLLDRSGVEKLKRLNDHPRMMRAAVASLKLPTGFITYKPESRVAGESKYGFTKMTKLALQGFWSYGRWQKWLGANALAWGLVLSIIFGLTGFHLKTGLAITLPACLCSALPLILRGYLNRKNKGEARSIAGDARYRIGNLIRLAPATENAAAA